MIDLSGHLVDLKRDFRSGKPLITFEVEEICEDIEKLKGDNLKLKIARKKEVRSLDSNDYFHVLNRKLAQKLNYSETYMKNILLGRYGQKEFLDEMETKHVTLTTQIPEYDFMQIEAMHVQCFDITVKNGITWYSYYVLRGSHTYNSEEMSRLIQGTIADCKEQGIETATPDELKKMAMLWENRGSKSK